MHTRDLQITRLIHENCGILMTFAFSQRPLVSLRTTRFVGSWKYLEKMCFELPAVRAGRAALELAIHLRVLDDQERLRDFYKGERALKIGTVYTKKGAARSMGFRDATNKIVHSSRFDWDFSVPEKPNLICHPVDGDKWSRAEIDIVSLAGFCAQLMS
jgi:hypothetical protein